MSYYILHLLRSKIDSRSMKVSAAWNDSKLLWWRVFWVYLWANSDAPFCNKPNKLWGGQHNSNLVLLICVVKNLCIEGGLLISFALKLPTHCFSSEAYESPLHVDRASFLAFPKCSEQCYSKNPSFVQSQDIRQTTKWILSSCPGLMQIFCLYFVQRKESCLECR